MPLNTVAKIAITAAMMAAQMALTASQKIKGPRLDSLKVSVADYGTAIPRFWGKRKFEVPVIWAEDLREQKVTNKTKGGKFQNYKYYGSFAVLICDHPIDAISRIWMDKHLVYDATSTGPISIGSIFNSSSVKLQQGKNYRVYLGTEDQLPDPRIETWCEDRYGPDSCPAYRGSSYIVFEELPLEKFGNRIPQITVEAVNNVSDQFPVEVVESLTWGNPSFTADGLRYISVEGSTFQAFDLPSRSLISSFSGGDFGVSHPYASAPSGIYAMNIVGTTVWRFTEDGSFADLGTNMLGGGWSGAHYAGGQILFSAGSFAGMNVGVYNRITNELTPIATNHFPSHFFTKVSDQSAVAVGTTTGNVLAIGPASGSATLIDTSAYGTTGQAYGFDNDENYVVWQGGRLFLIDYAYNILDDVVAPATTLAWNNINAVRPGAETFWVGQTEFRSSDLSVVRTVDLTDWDVPVFETGSVMFDPVLNALLRGAPSGDPHLVIRYLDRIDSDGVQLKDVVDDVSDWCGLTGQDTTDLTQTVLGYSVTQGSGKDMIEPLLTIHDVDPRPHDFGIEFVVRGSSPSKTLLTKDFVREGSRYTVTVQQDTDLPRRVTINFADNDKDQETNTAISQRPLDVVDSNREESIDLTTYAAEADEAQQLSDRRHRRIWNERERTKLALTAQEMALEPADVQTISLDGKERVVRLDKMTIRGSAIECEWIRDDPALHVLNGAQGAEMEGRDPEVIFIPGPTAGFVLDAPLIQDSHNDVNPIIYFAAGDYNTPSWSGAYTMRGDDGTYDDLYGFIETTSDATWGLTQEALGDVATPWLWDRGNTLDCTIYGTLVSVTEAECNEDPTLNLIAIGADDRWEYVQFVTAALTGTSGTANTYTLSGFKRGRRGTEGNTGNHEGGDRILVLAQAIPTEIGTDEIGNAMSFKIQTVGREIDGAPANDLTYDGNSLRPYAPARIIWTTDGTDMLGEIIRRTRIGGAWTGGSTIPLGENTEAYEVDVLDGGGNVTSTIAVTGTNTFTIEGLTSPPDVNVYQLSDTAGRGFPLAA